MNWSIHDRVAAVAVHHAINTFDGPMPGGSLVLVILSYFAFFAWMIGDGKRAEVSCRLDRRTCRIPALMRRCHGAARDVYGRYQASRYLESWSCGFRSTSHKRARAGRRR